MKKRTYSRRRETVSTVKKVDGEHAVRLRP